MLVYSFSALVISCPSVIERSSSDEAIPEERGLVAWRLPRFARNDTNGNNQSIGRFGFGEFEFWYCLRFRVWDLAFLILWARLKPRTTCRALSVASLGRWLLLFLPDGACARLQGLWLFPWVRLPFHTA